MEYNPHTKQFEHITLFEYVHRKHEIERYRDDVFRSMARNGDMSYLELRLMRPTPSIDPSVATPVDVLWYRADIINERLSTTEAT